MGKSGKDVYDIVNEQMIELLEKGVVPWQKNWATLGSLPTSFQTKKPYRGRNVMMLAMEQMLKGYSSPYWITRKQLNLAGGKLKPKQRYSMVTYWNFIERDVVENGVAKTKTIPFLRFFQVYNTDQCELPEGTVPTIELKDNNPIDNCEDILDRFEDCPEIRHGGNDAYYHKGEDYIQLPPLKHFDDSEGYYGTLFHEMVHSTGHAKRLDRFGKSAEGVAAHKEDYSKEELVAEMGSAYLCSIAGIDKKIEDHQAAYINHWMKAIKADKKLLMGACGKAQKAVDYILPGEVENESCS